MTRALIFDCDGVLSDTERDGHLVAFNKTFEHFGIPMRWSDDDYRTVLRIGGGKERLAALFAPGVREELGLPEDLEQQQKLIADWHRYKTARYTEAVRAGELPPRPGVRRIVEEAHEAGWRLAVASTSAEESVRAVLEHAVGAELAGQFTVCAGDAVPHKKPAPDIYLLALERLGVSAADAVAVEDSSNGLRAALAARIPTIVTTSSYTQDEDFTGAALVVDNLGDPFDPPVTVLANEGDITVGSQVTITELSQLHARS